MHAAAAAASAPRARTPAFVDPPGYARHRPETTLLCTTHVVLEPLDLMARLAALVPPQRMHLTRYHGMFALEIETCARCQGRLRVIASIEEPAVIARILAHRERDCGAAEPELAPIVARAPPRQAGKERVTGVLPTGSTRLAG